MPVALDTLRSAAGIRIAIDRGGTFCDVYATFAHRPPVILKVLSIDAAYPDAPTEAIRRVLEIGYDTAIPRGELLDLSGIEVIRMGTTVATKWGEKTAFLVSEGFRDLLHIGNQSRPDLFDLSAKRPGVLYERVIEVKERVLLADVYRLEGLPVVLGTSGERIQVEHVPDAGECRKHLQSLYDDGFRSLAISFLHSYTYPKHEILVADIAREVGFIHVSLSSQLSPMIRIVPRANSATADAYLTPELQKYLQGMLQFMQSDGGLVNAEAFSGLRAILSGPAGGVVGIAKTCWDEKLKVPLIGFDMGGTSTDVSRFDGRFEHLMESTTAGVTIQSPQLDINTVAAGGGSLLLWQNGLLKVGPQSAGASPGPACYRKGGPLTTTDANVFLGRLLPAHFPRIFGPDENQSLDADVVREKFTALAKQISTDTGVEKTPEEIALGFLTVATEAMCLPIRAISEARGYDPSSHHLAVFGGAGGQSACDVAVALDMSRILIHKSSAILSAFGLAKAELVDESQESFSIIADDSSFDILRSRLAILRVRSEGRLIAQGFTKSQLSSMSYLNMRYDGSDATLMIAVESSHDFVQVFKAKHHQEFGFSLEGRSVWVDDLRVYFGSTGWIDAGVYKLGQLTPGSVIKGPAIILDATQTIVVTPSAVAMVLDDHVVVDIDPENVDSEGKTDDPLAVDPIRLSVFGHRFMSIAEQMGRTLQKTSVSVNIKERLDFSCALFDPDGRLVANAPHVPAMLGSMQFAVRWQHEHWKGRLHDGDVILSNSAVSGGVHLPDITIVTPVFDDSGRDIIFYVASRGHHADVGGQTPGSMPPFSKTIYDEGASILTFKVLLVEEPLKHPGGKGTRALKDNLSDINAQIAATYKGVGLVKNLVSKYTLPVVQMYMYAIQSTAEEAVRQLLRKFSKRHSGKALVAFDRMDDGSPIALRIDIDRESGSATFDFTGTGPEVYGNWNAPRAIVNSSIIYALRCLLASDIPLNQGCMTPINVIIPDGCFLKPSADAAVCAGNVLTSQRLTDVVLRAFEACAAHMTNTRITDPEIMERRYPVILRRFSLRPGSGGKGRYHGGDGVVRDIEFRRTVQCSILSDPGALGVNLWISKDAQGKERALSIGGKNTAPMAKGDRIVIMTPGGGGYGTSNE
ncbi:5-oxoprolinase [Desarmillaria tabescens]|uniref:5-oxoprolinase n=1 Tax=Armillaria tabescens TaxID=1929756 RepID=A0AA39N1R8_ARMTA|nr:5-oxoprolinase [Desarmillaria tabescens]KAK0453995.1 5-oxoprolinase [Desarmillaria tabescens]